MMNLDLKQRIHAELATLKIKEADLNHKYKNIYHLGGGTFDLLPELERVRKRSVELEDALRVIREFERK